MRILISGGLGFIFSHVTEYFANNGHDVTVIDNLSDGSHKELLPEWGKQANITVSTQDVNILNDPGFRAATSIDPPPQWDVIIHAAAESNVDKSINDQSIFLHSNIYGTYSILEYVRQTQSNAQFIYVNSDEVYGSSTQFCAPSMSPVNPSNPYSASKAAAGHFCWAYHKTYGIRMKEVRMCNIIGRRQATTKLLPRVIDCLQHDKEIPVYDGGTNTREYMDVRDVSPLLELVVNSEQQTIFNLTYNQELSIMEVIEKAASILGKTPKLTTASRLGHDKCYRMTPHRIMLDLGARKRWKLPFHKIDDTIRWMVD